MSDIKLPELPEPHSYSGYVVGEDQTKAGLFTYEQMRECAKQAAELEACHMAMDGAAIPRADESGAVYSVWGRACRFAELARQDEWEACAKLCEEVSRPYQAAGASVALECAAAIRARSTPTDTTGSKEPA